MRSFLLAATGGLLLGAGAQAPGPTGGPEQHHLSLADGGDLVVSFATASGVDGQPRCSWGVASGSLPHRSVGTTKTYTDGGWVGLLHTVRLSGIAPASSGFYRCQVGAQPQGPEFPLTSAPKRGALPVTVAVVGDMGEGCDEVAQRVAVESGTALGKQVPGCSNTTIARLRKDLGSFGMLLHVGDIAYTSGTQTVWDSFLNEVEPIAASVPYQVCVGNHEHYYNFSGYLHRFAMQSTAPPSAPARLVIRIGGRLRELGSWSAAPDAR